MLKSYIPFEEEMISDGGHDGCLLALLVIIFLCVTLIIFCLYFSKQKTLPQNEHLCHFKFKTLQVLNYLFPFPFFLLTTN